MFRCVHQLLIPILVQTIYMDVVVQDISIWLRRRLPGDDVTNLIDLDSFKHYGRGHWKERRRRRKGEVTSRQPNNRKYAHLVKVYFSIPIPFCLLLPNVPPYLFKLLFITLPLGVSLFVDTPPCLVIITFCAAVIRSFHLHSSPYPGHNWGSRLFLWLCTVEYVSSAHPPIHTKVLAQE